MLLGHTPANDAADSDERGEGEMETECGMTGTCATDNIGTLAVEFKSSCDFDEGYTRKTTETVRCGPPQATCGPCTTVK